MDTESRFYGAVITVLCIIVGVKIFSMLATVVNNYATSIIAAKDNYNLKKTIFGAIERLSLSFFTSRQTGGLMTQVNTDANTIYEFFCNVIPHFLVNIAKVVILIILLFLINPFLALCALLVIPISIVTMRVSYGINRKLHAKRFVAIWVITAVIMLLSAVFGLQEQLLILYPVFAMLCTALNWSRFTAISFVLIASGVGFTTAITNPLTIGTAAIAAGVSVTDGLWYRLIIFCVMYVFTSLFLTTLAKHDEKRATEKFDVDGFVLVSPEERTADIRKAKMITVLFSVALLSVIITTAIKSLRSLAMVFMAVAFIVGTVIVGKLLLGTYSQLGKSFVKGVKDVLPSIVIIMIAFGITHIAQQGNILHTIFYYFYNSVTNISPYLAVLLLYIFILIIEFFIPSASAKAVLIIPMLTLAPIEGISTTVIILTYLFADGYTNVLYPTCGTLLVGLGLADVSFAQWFKKTILFQLLLMAISMGFLMLAVAIKL